MVLLDVHAQSDIVDEGGRGIGDLFDRVVASGVRAANRRIVRNEDT